MSRVIATYASGPATQWLEVSMPTFEEYASIHGYDLVLANDVDRLPGSGWAASRHPAWRKVPTIACLCRRYDEVLWLDADVAIRRMDVDIATEAVGDRRHFLVVHNTSDGAVPNSGVWFLRGVDGDEIDALRDLASFTRSGCWWEQAALIKSLGGDPDATPVSVPASNKWSELPYHWNPHCHDPRGIPADCRFFHATMFHDRAAAMREMLK